MFYRFFSRFNIYQLKFKVVLDYVLFLMLTSMVLATHVIAAGGGHSWCNFANGQHGYTALMSAVDGGRENPGGHPECVSLLLAAGTNMEAKDEVCIILPVASSATPCMRVNILRMCAFAN
jgi:hypothetical protein